MMLRTTLSLPDQTAEALPLFTLPMLSLSSHKVEDIADGQTVLLIFIEHMHV